MKTPSLWACLFMLLPFSWGQSVVSLSNTTFIVAVDQDSLTPTFQKSLTDSQPPDIPLISAHRGARFIAGYPENALETFQYISKQAPVIIECDVNMSSDSVLFLMHDNTLNRTTTGTGLVREVDWAEIQCLHLKDDYGIVTRYHPPALTSVLEWAFNDAQLTLDVKRGVPIEKVVELVRAKGAIAYASIITYNYEDALKAYLADPRVKLSVNIRNEEELQRYLNGPFNPRNLMAFTGLTQRSPAFYQKLKEAGIKVIIGTIGNLDKSAVAKGDLVYRNLHKAGADILATDRPIAVYRAFTSKVEPDTTRPN